MKTIFIDKNVENRLLYYWKKKTIFEMKWMNYV